MSAPASSLSVMCIAIYNFVRAGVGAVANSINVTMGAPAIPPEDESVVRVNLFFYRFEPYAFDADAHPLDPWRIRMYCLITAFGVAEEGVSAGENELRLLGSVMRIFREQPIMDSEDIAGEPVRLQVVFAPVTDELISQIWSTQGDITYRPSLVYEMSLVPIMPSSLRAKPSRVGMLGNQVYPGMQNRHAGFTKTAATPAFPKTSVNIRNPAWAPALCWLYQAQCVYTLSFEYEGAEHAAFQPQIWLAGDPATAVTLHWDQWIGGQWVTLTNTETASPYSSLIDPDHLPESVIGSFPLQLNLPDINLPAAENSTQLVLYATRESIPIAGPGETLRSNLLLLTLYRGS